MENNIETNGKCPTWLSDKKFSKKYIEEVWFGNECIGVMANLYYGLFLHDSKKYREYIVKGINYILDSFIENKLWESKYYDRYYTFYLVCRLLNALNIDDIRLELAKKQIISEQKLNGCWNDSAQDTASALLGLMSFGDVTPIIIQSGLVYLKDTQKYDGRWEGEDFYVCPGNNGSMDYYKNDKVTTAICLRALVKRRNSQIY